MADDRYGFCKIFVQAADPQAVAGQLAQLLSAQPQRHVLTLPEAIVDVRANPDAGLADDFAGWPAIVEVEADPEASDAAVVGLTSRIVTALWDSGRPAVAACDYEDELPWNGGLARLGDS